MITLVQFHQNNSDSWFAVKENKKKVKDKTCTFLNFNAPLRYIVTLNVILLLSHVEIGAIVYFQNYIDQQAPYCLYQEEKNANTTKIVFI